MCWGCLFLFLFIVHHWNFELVWDIIGVSLQSFLKKYTYLKSMVYTKLFLKIMFLMLHYRQTQKTWSVNHHCWGSDLNLFLFSSRRELFKDLSIVLDNLLLAIKKKYPRLPLKLRSIKKVNPLDYPWQNQIMKTVHSETGKSIRAYAEIFIQNPALF